MRFLLCQDMGPLSSSDPRINSTTTTTMLGRTRRKGEWREVTTCLKHENMKSESFVVETSGNVWVTQWMVSTWPGPGWPPVSRDGAGEATGTTTSTCPTPAHVLRCKVLLDYKVCIQVSTASPPVCLTRRADLTSPVTGTMSPQPSSTSSGEGSSGEGYSCSKILSGIYYWDQIPILYQRNTVFTQIQVWGGG